MIEPPPPPPPPEPEAPPRQRWLTPLRGGAIALGVVALAYGAANISLDLLGRPIREALAAWTPPLRAINLATTLPPPLPQLLSEGWLVAYKHPQGWLLVFRSDGAFDVGKAEVRASFQKNIERLGQAFAPWPGDLGGDRPHRPPTHPDQRLPQQSALVRGARALGGGLSAPDRDPRRRASARQRGGSPHRLLGTRRQRAVGRGADPCRL
ncbi:hypothetical protein JOS77_27735 [Chromobacterium haemolyticum]|nr:hypothetical protein JOS77_27735 [Chromobacterium haemolyticum]